MCVSKINSTRASASIEYYVPTDLSLNIQSVEQGTSKTRGTGDLTTTWCRSSLFMTLWMCRRYVIYRHKRKFTVRLNWADTGYWKNCILARSRRAIEQRCRDSAIPSPGGKRGRNYCNFTAIRRMEGEESRSVFSPNWKYVTLCRESIECSK